MKMALASLFVLVFTLSSCLSLKKTRMACKPLGNGASLAGTYINCLDSQCRMGESLLYILDRNVKHRDTLDNWSKLNVELQPAEKNLRVIARYRDTVVFQTTLKGHWKGNQFSVRRKIWPRGVPFVFYIYYEDKIILSPEGEGIALARGQSQMGWIFLFTAGTEYYRCYRYRKK